MKKLLSTLFLLFFTIIFSQEYQFDTMLTYEVKSNLSNSMSYNVNWFLNSKDNSYCLSVYDFEDKKAKLIDFKNNLIHKFKIQSKIIDGKNTYFFNYINSKKIPIITENNSNNVLSINISNEDTSNKEILITESSSLKYKLILAISEKELFYAVTPLIFERYLKPEELKFAESYILKSAEVISQNSTGFKFVLQGVENQIFDIKIKKMKIKN